MSKPTTKQEQPGPSKTKKAKSKKEIPVDLGFVEKVEHPWKLCSAFFVSKVGGNPAWLNLKDLPNAEELKCSFCGSPGQFLLQIYAPLDDPETFHRTIFVFLCSRQSCNAERNSNGNLMVFRCQLGRENDFYSKDPPNMESEELGSITPEKFGVSICRICGCKGEMSCGSCKSVNYCSKDHQQAHWKIRHKYECQQPDFEGSRYEGGSGFNEFELVLDTEVIPKTSKKKVNEELELEKYKKLVAAGKAGSLADADVTQDLLDASSFKSDKAFNKFKERIAYEPEQVLRYDRKGEPLWVSEEEGSVVDKVNIPPCPHCKGPRVFEFQVMPQLLNYLEIDNVDWGTLAIYTCEKSCNLGPAYKQEFIWKQDFQLDEEGGPTVNKKMKRLALSEPNEDEDDDE